MELSVCSSAYFHTNEVALLFAFMKCVETIARNNVPHGCILYQMHLLRHLYMHLLELAPVQKILSEREELLILLPNIVLAL